VEYGHYFPDHCVVVAVEPPHIIAPEGVGNRIDETTIAERARPLWEITSLGQNLRQIIIGNEGPGNRYPITVAFGDDLAD
jgi:hypothetical protein